MRQIGPLFIRVSRHLRSNIRFIATSTTALVSCQVAPPNDPIFHSKLSIPPSKQRLPPCPAAMTRP